LGIELGARSVTDQSNTPSETPSEPETPVHIPPIDFSTPTEDQMTEVRKGVGGERRTDND
jgi:hypothetical protein